MKIRLSSELDIAHIARDSGLKGKDVDAFAKGLAGPKRKPQALILPRQAYTALQCYFEASLLDVIDGYPKYVFPDQEDQVRPPFIYATPNLATPLHNPRHPRAEHMVKMLQPKNFEAPLAVFVCNADGGEAIANMPHVLEKKKNLARMRALLTPHFSAFDPFSYNDPHHPSTNSFMTTRGFGDLTPVCFEASQSPDLQNQKPGKIWFGEEAIYHYERALVRHIINQEKGRTSQGIRDIFAAKKP